MVAYYYNGERYNLTELIKLAKKEGISLKDMDLKYDNGGDPIEVFRKDAGAVRSELTNKLNEEKAKLQEAEKVVAEKDDEIAKLKALLAGKQAGNSESVIIAGEEISKEVISEMKKPEAVDLAKKAGIDTAGKTLTILKNELLNYNGELL